MVERFIKSVTMPMAHTVRGSEKTEIEETVGALKTRLDTV
jgi:hypothetical protein